MDQKDSTSRRSLSDLLDHQRALVCLGPGGVGKTTLSASLALEAASRGRKVLCLTIDPAKRLANAIGLEGWPSGGSVDLTARASSVMEIPACASLRFSHLDPREILEGIIRRFSDSDRAAQRIFSTPLYQHLFLHLPGMIDYLALERILEIRSDRSVDLLVLDTSPSAQTLEFFGTPRKLLEFLEGSANTFTSRRSHASTGRNGATHYAGLALRGMSLLAGREAFGTILQFVDDCSEIFGYLHSQAEAMEKNLRSEETSCFLITSPNPLRVRESLEVIRRMSDLHIRLDAVIFNQVHPPPDPEEPSSSTLTSQLVGHGIPEPQAGRLAKKLILLRKDRLARVRAEEEAISHLLGVTSMDGRPVSRIPALELDVGDLQSLKKIARHIVREGRDAVQA